MEEYNNLKIKAYILTAISTSLMICFGSLEVKQMLVNGLEYFSDYWNCIDTVSILCNLTLISSYSYTLIMENEQIDIRLIRTFGAFASFLMWVKIFYWMRLFSSLAYYVKLIQDTIIEMSNFILMVMIICLAFANYYYIVSLNLEGTGKTYYNPFYGKEHTVTNSIMLVYLMGALGDFSSGDFSEGYNSSSAMSMFVLATFLILVVFMNMLIAIMGDTFGRV